MCGKHQSVASHASPNWELGPQPRRVPWLGIELVTFCFVGRCPTHWATPVRARTAFKCVLLLCSCERGPVPEACLPCVHRLFGGLVLDIKRKAPWYWSDYRDALSLQCLASFLFLYCACMSPVITFGGLLGEATEGRIVRTFNHSKCPKEDLKYWDGSQVPWGRSSWARTRETGISPLNCCGVPTSYHTATQCGMLFP